jgi:heme exporter protein D
VDVLEMLSALGAVITGTVPVAVVLLWLIWREQRRLAEVEREKMRRAARKARQQEEPDRGGS